MQASTAQSSFSPDELRQFVSAIDNGPVAINIEVATAIFLEGGDPLNFEEMFGIPPNRVLRCNHNKLKS